MVRALSLFSGGLDSRLAARIMQLQGVEVVLVNFLHIFSPRKSANSEQAGVRSFARKFGMQVVYESRSREMIRLIINPAHGYGKNVNPCIDCRIGMLARARAMLPEYDARFIVTGEVVGQRPMSQRRHTMKIIDRKAGVEGLVLRPLSAGALKPTIPEEKGWVDRDGLYGITGRGRKEQAALACELGIGDYPSPGGGCLLTFGGFAAKVRDLVETGAEGLNDYHLLKAGRHFRLDGATKLVVGKNEYDNRLIYTFARRGDLLLLPRVVPGPTALIRGEGSGESIRLAASILARYTTKAPEGERLIVDVFDYMMNPQSSVQVEKADEGSAAGYRTGE